MRPTIIPTFSLACAFLLSLTTCKDKNCPPSLLYQVPYTLTPTRDTFALGDTIVLEMDFSDVLTDIQGGVENTFTNYDFRLRLLCDRFDIDPPTAQAVSFFDASTTIGSSEVVTLSQSAVSFYQLTPVYTDRRYRLKTVLTLKQTGMFGLAISPFEARFEPFEIKGKCDHVPVHIGNKLNNGVAEENNYYLLKSSPVDVYKNMTEERFGGGGYCFVVR